VRQALITLLAEVDVAVSAMTDDARRAWDELTIGHASPGA